MILELFDYQFIIICYKSGAKLQKNIQTTKYQFFRYKKDTPCNHYIVCPQTKLFKFYAYENIYLTFNKQRQNINL